MKPSSIHTLSFIKTLRDASKKSLSLVGLIATLFGFISDVLTPIAPFALYLCIISVLAVTGCILVKLLLKKTMINAFFFSLLVFISSGVLTLLQRGEEHSTQGFLSSSIPLVETIQEKIGILQKEVTEIKNNTEEIKTTTKAIDKNLNSVNKKADKILEKVATLSNSGGIIINPTSPEDHYHNARIQELSGDYIAARGSYLRYFNSNAQKLDPHLRFIKFLTIQEGRAGAAETYRAITSESTTPLTTYTNILVIPDRTTKIQKLKEFAKTNPTFGAVWYHLSQEYSSVKLVTPTLNDRRNELSFCKKFITAYETGAIVKYFIDQELVSKWVADAEQRINLIEKSALGNTLKNPVTINWSKSNGGWTGSIIIKEKTTAVYWKFKHQDQPPQKAENLSYSMDESNITMKMIQLPNSAKKGELQITYTDKEDTYHGPYLFDFDPVADSLSQAIQYSKMTKHSWIELRANPVSPEEKLLYFTTMLVYRSAFKKILYGIEKEQPDTEFTFPASSEAFAPITDDLSQKCMLKVPKSTTFATVQVIYKNGETSEVIRVEQKK